NPKWPKRRGLVWIPYVLSGRFDPSSTRVLEEALGDLARLTCVRFVPRSHQRDFIIIAPMGGCFSSVGRVGGPQLLSLAPPCLQGGKGVALHELLHAVGFGHEHSRPDRDAFISIAWSHVLPGFEGNFMKSRSANTLVGYDYSSVLHYGRYAFSRGAEPTITPLRDPRAVLGQRRGLSASDVARVKRLYGCAQGGWHWGGDTGGGSTPGSRQRAHSWGARQPSWGGGVLDPGWGAPPCCRRCPEDPRTAVGGQPQSWGGHPQSEEGSP
uniref:Metalloendopeptidase n=1 Tax=Anas platyrhynchos TaxID=8839 RepID=A0A8B9R0Y3_ANAPL